MRLLLAVETKLFRDGLALILDGNSFVEVIGAAASFAEAGTLIQRLKPNALLVDAAMADCTVEIRRITQRHPTLKVVTIATPETSAGVLACAEAGAAGYVPHDASVEALVEVLRAVDRDEFCCSRTIAAVLLRRVAELAPQNHVQDASAATLTRRELDVLRLLEAGRSNKEIARTLGIGLCTAKNHVHSVLQKLGARRRGEATAVASRLPALRANASAGAAPR